MVSGVTRAGMAREMRGLYCGCSNADKNNVAI